MQIKIRSTICFIRKKNKILLLNREKPPWMGRWNGVGGKIRENETPDACIRREILEETGLDLERIECLSIAMEIS